MYKQPYWSNASKNFRGTTFDEVLDFLKTFCQETQFPVRHLKIDPKEYFPTENTSHPKIMKRGNVRCNFKPKDYQAKVIGDDGKVRRSDKNPFCLEMKFHFDIKTKTYHFSKFDSIHHKDCNLVSYSKANKILLTSLNQLLDKEIEEIKCLGSMHLPVPKIRQLLQCKFGNSRLYSSVLINNLKFIGLKESLGNDKDCMSTLYKTGFSFYFLLKKLII